MSYFLNLINNLDRLSFANRVAVYVYLRHHLTLDETQAQCSLNASNPEFYKGLLCKKKELAIVEVYDTLPYIGVANFTSKNAFLKVLPVLLSYSTLYEMKVQYVSQILDMLRVHPAFINDAKIFEQWFIVFHKRQLCRTREFSYKDEFYFQNLPKMDPVPGNYFSLCVGYSDISLLRAFHRWLRLHRLHKYLFVFANLKYEQIILIDETNIDDMVSSVAIFNMTIGAKNKILRELAELRKRSEMLLSNVIRKVYYNASDLEEAVRIIKKILRTPIKVDDDFNENIPALLVKALKTVCETILLDCVTFSEGMIPLYGLLISVLKEAWNYTIFTCQDKDWFNEWRIALSEKINNNFNSSPVTMSRSASVICLPDFMNSRSASAICLPNLKENLKL
ncbi:uncharacterized protein LOC135832333 [Planococcus citri]|uniref:uncharacterized protein LOC135832333 n=1 Tax=Planococcus citri TaxID=170843 RepID=UPI0031F8B7C8